MPPLVSAVIPVFNGSNYLREAIDSVLAQTFADYELLVVDDGSTDGTWEIIQSYGDRVRGFHKRNGGVASALNVGIQEMQGRWFAWLSHDDLWLPAKLETQVASLQANPQFGACYTDYYLIDADGDISGEVETPWYPREKALREIFRGAYINGSTMVVDRACFDQVGLFGERWRYNQDTEMWLRILRLFGIGRVPKKLGKQRVHPAQTSRNIGVHKAETLEMFAQVFEEFGVRELFPEWASSADDPAVIASMRAWFGDSMAYSQKAYVFAEKQYLQALRLYPSWRNLAWRRLAVNSPRMVCSYLRQVIVKHAPVEAVTVWRQLRRRGTRG